MSILLAFSPLLLYFSLTLINVGILAIHIMTQPFKQYNDGNYIIIYINYYVIIIHITYINTKY